MSINETKPYLKAFHFLKYFLLLSFLIGQEQMSSDWIEVRGRTSEGVKAIIRVETRKVDIYVDKVIDKAVNNIEIENDERTTNFNSKKADLRASLNLAIDEKNSVSMAVNDLKDQVALQRSNIMNYRQKISDADSSIANSKHLIMEEKDRVLDALTKIPFFEVLIGKVKNFPPGKNPIPYEDAIASKISREAIDSQLGVDIVKETIIEDGTLSKESVVALLKGKANTNLNRYEDQIEDETGKAFYDLYRYGLVAVYPFQESDVALLKEKESGIKVYVQVVRSVGDGLSEVLDKDNLKQLKKMINEKKLKNSDSEVQVKRLARTAKQVIRRENGKIKASEKIIASNREKIANEEPTLNIDETQLQDDLQDQQVANNNFMIDQNAYNNHVASEEYVRVFPGVGQATATEEKESRFAEIATNTYEDFITSIKSEYLKEETEIKGEALSEIKESKKSDIKLNSVKIVGKFSKKEYGKINLITYVAYNFGFEFEQITDAQPVVAETSTKTVSKKPVYTKPTHRASFNLTVTSNPSGAVVSSGGKKLGTTPLNTYLEPGMHSLTITKDGYNSSMDVVSVSGIGTKEKHVKLQPVIAKKSKTKRETGKSLLSRRNMIIAGVVLAGGAYVILSQKEEPANNIGSIAVTINIP